MVKDVHELALGSANVAAITPQALGTIVDKLTEKKLVWGQFFEEDRDIVGEGKPYEKMYPSMDWGVTVDWDVSEGSTIGEGGYITYARDTLRVVKAGVKMKFTTESITAAMRDVMRDHLDQAGRRWSQTLDTVAYNAVISPTLTYCTLPATGDTIAFSTFTPWIEIVSVLGPASADRSSYVNVVDYFGGTIYFTSTFSTATTINFKYSNRVKATSLFTDARWAGTVSSWDILRGRAKLVGQDEPFHPNVLVMHDDDIPGLLYDEKIKFLDISAYPGAQRVIFNAELGTLFGMRLVSTTKMPSGMVVYMESPVGKDLRKQELQFFREEKYEYDSIWYHGWAYRNYGVVPSKRAYKIAMSVNHKQELYPATNKTA